MYSSSAGSSSRASSPDLISLDELRSSPQVSNFSQTTFHLDTSFSFKIEGRKSPLVLIPSSCGSQQSNYRLASSSRLVPSVEDHEQVVKKIPISCGKPLVA